MIFIVYRRQRFFRNFDAAILALSPVVRPHPCPFFSSIIGKLRDAARDACEFGIRVDSENGKCKERRHKRSSLAASNIVIQVGLMLAGCSVFGDPVILCLIFRVQCNIPRVVIVYIFKIN